MEVPIKEYTVESFQAFLNKEAKNYSQGQLKIVCLLVFTQDQDSRGSPTVDQLFRDRGFFVRRLGDIRELSVKIIDRKSGNAIPVTLYASPSHGNQILKCFTTDRAEDIDRALGNATSSPGL